MIEKKNNSIKIKKKKKKKTFYARIVIRLKLISLYYFGTSSFILMYILK
jgi:hypothetical protein